VQVLLLGIDLSQWPEAQSESTAQLPGIGEGGGTGSALQQ